MYTDVGSVEIKTEADSNDVMECRHDDMPSTGMSIVLLRCDILMFKQYRFLWQAVSTRLL